MGAVSPLACAEEVQSTATIRQSCPGRRGQAEGGAKTILTLAGLDVYTVDLSRLPQGGVLNSEHNRPVSQYCIHKKKIRPFRFIPICRGNLSVLVYENETKSLCI